MVYEFIKKNYKEMEPIFFGDLLNGEVSKSAVNQQLSKLCKEGLLVKYDTGIYYIPKRSALNLNVSLSADTVAMYKYIKSGKKIDGYYCGNAFANQLGISNQVPRIVEIVSNNTNSSPRTVEIGKRQFLVKKPIVKVTNDNVHILQMLDLLKNIDDYVDSSYDEVKNKIYEYIRLHNITKEDVDKYIRFFPLSIFKNYYEMELNNVLA